MKNDVVICIRCSVDEYRYAKALSKRTGCPLKNSGSVAYGFKWSLRQQAKKENVNLK